MIKNLIFIFVTLFFTACSIKFDMPFSKEPNSELKKEITKVLYLMKKDDLESLNSNYINKDFGFYEFRLDREFNLITEHKFTLEEVDKFIEIFEISSKPVEFDCSFDLDTGYGWKEDGVFVIKNRVNYFDNYKFKDEKEKKFINNILKNGYEVITLSQMIFYMSRFEGKYYIVLIDNVKTDCRKKFEIESKNL
ncbi:hypothetical protein [Aliarcobacter skirrowii]|uniref:Lipoprotein n=1 Tax=Aliarcobacter skirrowii TaxID=28200 RepID=A0A2U2C3D6_9BACT|nr:hypothetical protein [Aliarcobacter skirrowii]PWE22581.1 hypothetical protein DGF29_00590 [Aliarcobacter skirrowii]PWE23542.1 hypothetical protein DF188_02380 [Aliarcobacter skirrowii]PWE26265.1 hypothetical protein DGE88_01245 [Aliarcobacter skirrowii]RJO56770.1 hypothetical protein DIR39_02420 [Aliarcobacter skirrowii]RJO58724.1 hypothetical protein DIR38_02420 [Aliarcobacter skirrowii]